MAFATSVLPTPAGPSSMSGRPTLTARNTAVARPRSAMYDARCRPSSASSTPASRWELGATSCSAGGCGSGAANSGPVTEGEGGHHGEREHDHERDDAPGDRASCDVHDVDR